MAASPPPSPGNVLAMRRALIAFVLLPACSGGSSGSGSGTDSATSSGTATDSATASTGSTGGTSSGTSNSTSGSTTAGSTGGTGGFCPGVGPWPDATDAPWIVSKDEAGDPLYNGGLPSVSADGRLIAFTSILDASYEGATENLFDVFIYDAQCDYPTRVPFVHPRDKITEAVWPVISADGLHVAFVSRNEDLVTETYVYDVIGEVIEPISVLPDDTLANSNSEFPAISADGRVVVFTSLGALVPEDDNDFEDVYVRDRDTGTTERVSVATDGTQANGWSQWPDISADGRFVAFQSVAWNLEPMGFNDQKIFVRDRETDTTEIISLDPNDEVFGSSAQPTLSADGRYVAFTSSDELVLDDTNGVSDVYLHDRQMGSTTRVSLDSMGQQLAEHSFTARISADGQRVAFIRGLYVVGQSGAQLHVKDLGTGALTRVTNNANDEVADGNIFNPKISADGQWAVFETQAMNLTDPPKTNPAFDAFAVALP